MNDFRIPPCFFLFNDMRIPIPQREIHIEISKIPGNLFEQPALFLPNFDNIFIGSPVALNSSQPLLKEKGQIMRFGHRNHQTLHTQMPITLRTALKKHCVEAHLIEHLNQALFVVGELFVYVFVELQAAADVLDGTEIEIEVVFELLLVWDGQVDVLGGADDPGEAVLRAVFAV